MKWGNEHIGGKETGPVRFVLAGDQQAAFRLQPQARIILGEFKKRVQQQTNNKTDTRYTHKVEREDGSAIVVSTVLGSDGYHDIDVALIYVPIKKKKKDGKRRCNGYIVQCFSTAYPTAGNYYFIIRTPSKTILDTYNIGYLDDITYNGFPDFGAKYISMSNYDIVSSSYVNKGLQIIMVQSQFATTVTTGTGPTVYTARPLGTEPPNAPGWNTVFADSYSSGVCGVDIDYGTNVTWIESANVATPTNIIAYVYDPLKVYPGHTDATDINAGYDLHTGTWGLNYDAASYYTGGHTQSVAPFFPDSCVRDAGSENPWAGSGMSSTDWEVAFDEYWGEVLNLDNRITAYNAASALGYANFLSYHPSSDVRSYRDTDFPGTPNQFLRLYRNIDGKGLVTQSGFSLLSNRITFNIRSDLTGNSSAFMIPMKGEDRRLDYSQSLKDSLVPMGSHTEYKYYDAGSSTGYAGVGYNSPFGTPPYNPPPADDPTLNFYVTHENNVSKTVDTDVNIESPFGSPILVEDGIHSVDVIGATGKAKVWLLLDDGFFKININMTEDYSRATATLKIKVGEYTDISEVLLSAEPTVY